MDSVKFKMFLSEYTINFVDSIVSDDGGSTYGTESLDTHEINIATHLPDGTPISKDDIKITVMHELIHLILDDGQYNSQSENEALVEWIAKCLSSLSFDGVIDDVYNKIDLIEF